MNGSIVIIGGGVAAVNAAKAIRESDTESKIYIIQKESIYPYYRTRLTKSLFENIGANNIMLQKKEWYEQNNITVYLGREVKEIDTEQCFVVLDDGNSLKYDKLLLANGAVNYRPPIDGITKENVFTIRTFDDIQIIKDRIGEVETVLLIGGGIQNLEAAWAFSSQGKEVIIAEFMDKLMPRQLDDRASVILKKSVEAANIKVMLGTQVVTLTGENTVTGALTKNGEQITCDMAIYSVGIRPNIKILENTPLKTNLGVIVNEHMQTNIANIYAAGDIAELNGRIGGLWSIAIEQGKTAGYNMTGKTKVYQSSLPITTMNAFLLTVFSVGSIDEESYTHTIIDDPKDEKSYKRIFIHDNIITGAIIIGDIKYNNLLKKFVEEKIDIVGVDFTDITVNQFLEQLKTL